VTFLSHTGGGTDPTGALVVSPRFAEADTTYKRTLDPYGLLRTVEDLLGLKPLGNAAMAPTVARSLFPKAFG
jgi:hypothetical protein